MIVSLDIWITNTAPTIDEIFGKPGLFKFGYISFIYAPTQSTYPQPLNGKLMWVNFKQCRFFPEDNGAIGFSNWFDPNVKWKYKINYKQDGQSALYHNTQKLVDVLTGYGMTRLAP